MAIKYPSTYNNSQVDNFLRKFYSLSDTKPPHDHDPYVSAFVSDGFLQMGALKAHGHDEIAELRQKIWTGIVKRHHVVEQVFPFTSDDTHPQELCITGTVTYTLENGTESSVDWAARMTLNGESKIEHYTVYMAR